MLVRTRRTSTNRGYREDRKFLWAQSYLEERKNYRHLGVNFNLPAGTGGAALCNAAFIRIDDDHDLAGGWGQRIVLQPEAERPYVIFADLENVRVEVGEVGGPGEVIAHIGTPPMNGNRFPHLHLQTVGRGHFRQLQLLRNDLKELDGHGS